MKHRCDTRLGETLQPRRIIWNLLCFIPRWQFGNDDPKQLLAGYGWVTEMLEPKDIEAGYGRYPKSLPIGIETADQDDGRGVWLVNAIKV